MSLVVNTNVQSINTQRALYNAKGMLDKTLERLSSGYRINRAADDAAGLAISNEMRTQIRGTAQAIRNAKDGIAVLNVVDGSYNQIVENLQRMRELTKQAGNDTYDTIKRNQIKTELDQIKTEITRIANGTKFNGVQLLSATVVGSYRIQVAAGNNITATGTDTIALSAAFSNTVASTGGLLLGTTDVTTATRANALASRLDAGLAALATRLSNVGALTNRLEGIIKNSQVYQENVSAAESRIRNTDVALESSNLSRYQILQQSALSMLAQANASPQAALSLLRGQ